MGSKSFVKRILLIAALLGFLQSRSVAQADTNPESTGENGSWTATAQDGNPTGPSKPAKTYQTHTEDNGRTLDSTVVQRSDGGDYGLYLETERESVRVDPGTVRTVERVYRRDPNGGKMLARVTEEETRNDTDGKTTVVRTVSDATANGDLQVRERQLQVTKQTSSQVKETTITTLAPDVNGGFSPIKKQEVQETRTGEHDVHFKNSTLLPDGNGSWQLDEVREGDSKAEGATNQVKDESVWRKNAEGNLSLVRRTVTREEESAPGEKRKVVETYLTTVPGGFGDGRLILNRRDTTVQRVPSDGGKITEERVEEINSGDPSGGIRLTRKATGVEQPGASGATGSQQTVQSLDPNGNWSTIWVDTRQQSGTNVIVVDTKKADTAAPVQLNIGQPPKP